MDVINVLNSYGQSISTYSPYTNQFNLPTQNLSDGTYILIIRGKSFSEAKRLIVAH
jgi:hypothetical protein